MMRCYGNMCGCGKVVCQNEGQFLELVVGSDGSVQAFPWNGSLDGFTEVMVEDLPEYGEFFDNQ